MCFYMCFFLFFCKKSAFIPRLKHLGFPALIILIICNLAIHKQIAA